MPSFNCDHIANCLCTCEWTMKVWELPESKIIPQFPIGGINKHDLLEIKSHPHCTHENIKSEAQ